MSEKSSGAKTSKSGASSKSKPAASDKKSAKKSESKSEASDSGADKSTDSGTDSGADSGTDSGSDSSTDSGTDSSSEKSTDSGAGKSQKQTVSKGDVHYGYFSSVRTPAYRKGWDDIFAKKKSGQPAAEKSTAGARPNKQARIKTSIIVELDINALPKKLRLALGDEICRQTRRQRANYDKLDAAGRVRWRIRCEIKR